MFQDMLAMSSGNSGGTEIEFTIVSGMSAMTMFRKEDYSKFEIMINSINSGYPMSLIGSTDKTDYTSLKTWSATTSTYEDILSYLGNYNYFYFKNTANIAANITAKAKTV